MYRLGRHWNTIQAYLIPGIEDDIGELGEDLKRFAQTCELLINDAMFAARQDFVVARSAKLVGIDYAETFDSA